MFSASTVCYVSLFHFGCEFRLQKATTMSPLLLHFSQSKPAAPLPPPPFHPCPPRPSLQRNIVTISPVSPPTNPPLSTAWHKSRCQPTSLPTSHCVLLILFFLNPPPRSFNAPLRLSLPSVPPTRRLLNIFRLFRFSFYKCTAPLFTVSSELPILHNLHRIRLPFITHNCSIPTTSLLSALAICLCTPHCLVVARHFCIALAPISNQYHASTRSHAQALSPPYLSSLHAPRPCIFLLCVFFLSLPLLLLKALYCFLVNCIPSVLSRFQTCVNLIVSCI